MGTISTTIKDIDEALYRKFRAKCVEKNIKTGDAITSLVRKRGKINKTGRP